MFFNFQINKEASVKKKNGLTLSQKIKSGACCAHCSRELNPTNGDAVWLRNNGNQIRVCYEHILKLANRPDSPLPTVPCSIKKFDPGEFLNNLINLEKPNKDSLLREFLDRPPIREFIQNLC